MCSKPLKSIRRSHISCIQLYNLDKSSGGSSTNTTDLFPGVGGTRVELFCEINLRLEEIPNLLMILLFSLISQNSATGPERKDECKFTQPFQLRIDFQKQLTVH